MIICSVDCTKTLRLRIKDKHARVLSAMAREVNQVWNFCNETSRRAIRERHQWLSGYDLQKLTNGYSKCDGIHIGSPTVQQVCEDYAKARKQFKKPNCVGVSLTPKQQIQPGLDSVQRHGLAIQSRANRLCGPEIQPVGQLRPGGLRATRRQLQRGQPRALVSQCGSQGASQGSSATASVGIDLGLKEVAVASNGQRIEGRFTASWRQTWVSPSAPTRSGASKPSTQNCEPAQRRAAQIQHRAGARKRRHLCRRRGQQQAGQNQDGQSTLDAGWAS